jgi:hypothetical protein
MTGFERPIDIKQNTTEIKKNITKKREKDVTEQRDKTWPDKIRPVTKPAKNTIK